MLEDESPRAELEFTLDMMQTALKCFEMFEEDDVLTVRQDDHGIWLVSTNRRAFLGKARMPRQPLERLH